MAEPDPSTGPDSTLVERHAREAVHELVRLATTTHCAAAVGSPHAARTATDALVPAARAAARALTAACARLPAAQEAMPTALPSTLEAALQRMARSPPAPTRTASRSSCDVHQDFRHSRYRPLYRESVRGRHRIGKPTASRHPAWTEGEKGS